MGEVRRGPSLGDAMMRGIGSLLREIVDEAERLSERRLSDEREFPAPAPRQAPAIEEDEFETWN